MLVSLADMKTFLGISVNTYDAFLTEQLNLVSDTVEMYCRRKFASASYTQTWYSDDLENLKQIIAFHFPIVSTTSLKIDGEDLDAEDYRIHKPSGIIKVLTEIGRSWDEIVLIYTAGYATIPTPIDAVIKQIVQERYNKKVSGVSLSFGSDVQRVSIPGTISIDFDYSLENNQRKSAFGIILGSTTNVLDAFRSERPITLIQENPFVT